MASQRFITAVIGYKSCLSVLSHRNGLKLAVNDLFLLEIIRDYNDIGVKCGLKHLEQVLTLVGRRTARALTQSDLARLTAAGLVVSRRAPGWYKLLNLSLTISGIQLLSDFERLLSNYKVKGLPVV